MVSKAKVNLHEKIAVHLYRGTRSRKLSNVRRNLFGMQSRKSDMTVQLLDRQITDMAKKASREWNFDFVNELPRPGRYVWQRVPSCDVPFWYAAVSRPALKEAKSASDNTRLLMECEPQNCRCTEPKVDEGGVDEKPSRRKPRLVQTTMKDFSRVKKRRCSDRLRLKQVQVYSNKLRNHCHHIPVHCRGVLT